MIKPFKVLMGIFELKDAVQEFKTAKGKSVPELSDMKWLTNFAVLKDMYMYIRVICI